MSQFNLKFKKINNRCTLSFKCIFLTAYFSVKLSNYFTGQRQFYNFGKLSWNVLIYNYTLFFYRCQWKISFTVHYFSKYSLFYINIYVVFLTDIFQSKYRIIIPSNTNFITQENCLGLFTFIIIDYSFIGVNGRVLSL